MARMRKLNFFVEKWTKKNVENVETIDTSSAY